MNSLQYMRADERAEAGGVISPEPLLGTWLNTNHSTQGIARAVLAGRGQNIKLRIYAADDPALRDWGETEASLFAADTGSTEAMAFSAFYDFGFMETYLQAHVRQGVLIIAKFDRFKDKSGRSN
jgi:hypothetical protein